MADEPVVAEVVSAEYDRLTKVNCPQGTVYS